MGIRAEASKAGAQREEWVEMGRVSSRQDSPGNGLGSREWEEGQQKSEQGAQPLN